jgi:hypothetical protein
MKKTRSKKSRDTVPLRELLGSFIAGTEDWRRREEYLKYRF